MDCYCGSILLREIIENITQPGTPVEVHLKASKFIDKLKDDLGRNWEFI